MRRPSPESSPTRPFGPAASLGMAALALVPGVAALAWVLSPPGIEIALAVFAAGTLLAFRGIGSAYPHDMLGFANAVTLMRLALAAALAGSLAAGAASGVAAWSITAVAAVALALDGADGWLARRQGLVSEFGARFDMEVDSLLAAVLAGIVLLEGKTGPEVLILGLARYLFVGASAVMPWLAAPLPESMRRKAVCVLQIGTLVVLTVPDVAGTGARAMAVVAAAALVWSFACDIRWLARRG